MMCGRFWNAKKDSKKSTTHHYGHAYNLPPESTTYDCKPTLPSCIIKAPIVRAKAGARANTLGGALIFGVADDGQIVGLTEPDSDAEKISEIIKTRMEPIQ